MDSDAAPRRFTFVLPSGMKLAADAFGDESARPVVFLHGGGQTRHAWEGTARAVAEAGFRAISIDQRGHGESDRAVDGDYSNKSFVEDLREVCSQLNQVNQLNHVDRRPILVGASLGGVAALLAETKTPESICAGIVFVDVTPRMEIDGIKRIVGFMAARPDGFASLEEAADTIAAYQPHRPRPKNISGLEKNLRRGADGRYRWHWDPALMRRWNPARFDPEESVRIVAERLDAARRLRVPTMLVRGRMSDVVSEAGAREFLEVVPHAHYVDLAAAGHMVAGDRNDAFTASVIEFLRTEFPSSATTR